MTTPKPGSIFTHATDVANALRQPTPLTSKDAWLIERVEKNGCYHPLFVSAEIDGKDKPIVERMSITLGKFLQLACDDMHARSEMYEPRIIIQSIAWKNRETGKFHIGIAAGTNNPDVPLLEFPTQQTLRGIANLKKELLGEKGDGLFSAHWQMAPVAIRDEGMVAAYQWKTENPRQAALAKFMYELALQHGYRVKMSAADVEGNVTLSMPKADLERFYAAEVGTSNDGPRP